MTTIRMDAALFAEFQAAIDGRDETQREFVEVAVRRELARRRKADRKGAANGGK